MYSMYDYVSINEHRLQACEESAEACKHSMNSVSNWRERDLGLTLNLHLIDSKNFMYVAV